MNNLAFHRETRDSIGTGTRGLPKCQGVTAPSGHEDEVIIRSRSRPDQLVPLQSPSSRCPARPSRRRETRDERRPGMLPPPPPPPSHAHLPHADSLGVTRGTEPPLAPPCRARRPAIPTPGPASGREEDAPLLTRTRISDAMLPGNHFRVKGQLPVPGRRRVFARGLVLAPKGTRPRPGRAGAETPSAREQRGAGPTVHELRARACVTEKLRAPGLSLTSLPLGPRR